jgi:hypothetical protein
VHEKAHVGVVRIDVKVVNALRVDQRCATLNAMYDVAFGEQQLGEIGSILARATLSPLGGSGGFIV